MGFGCQRVLKRIVRSALVGEKGGGRRIESDRSACTPKPCADEGFDNCFAVLILMLLGPLPVAHCLSATATSCVFKTEKL
jgi:hypothetical protein